MKLTRTCTQHYAVHLEDRVVEELQCQVAEFGSIEQTSQLTEEEGLPIADFDCFFLVLTHAANKIPMRSPQNQQWKAEDSIFHKFTLFSFDFAATLQKGRKA